MSGTASAIKDLVEVALIAIFGFGIAFYLGATFLTALVSGLAFNAVNSILGGFASAITTVFIPIISILFILFLYDIAKKRGLFGKNGKGE